MEQIEITLEQIADLPQGSYLLIDTRDAISFEYGTLEDAVSIPDVIEEASQDRLPRDKKLILFCMHGYISLSLAGELREQGYDAYSLKNGYAAFLMAISENQENRTREIELSISKNRNFHEKLFSRFAKGITKYELIQPGDRIAVCISGGKDSMLMAKLFQEIQRHRKVDFELVFLVMDPGYNELNRLLIENTAKTMGKTSR